jgi:hypothetical protein
LTESVRQALLAANEGFTDSTYYEGKNYREQRDYEISDGELHVRSRSKTSWADSRRDDTYVADKDTTHRFLRNNLSVLNTDGVRERAAEIEPGLREARKKARKAEDEARAQREVDAAQYNRDAPDEVDSSGSLVDGRTVVYLLLGTLAGGAGWRIWNVKVKPWREARRARRDAAPQAAVDEDSQSPAPGPGPVGPDGLLSDPLRPDH